MIDWGYFKNPIEAPIKIGLDFLTGNLKTDGKKNTPIDYVAPYVNEYVETKKKQFIPLPEQAKEPAQEWVEEKVTKPAQEFVQEKVTKPAQEFVQEKVTEPAQEFVQEKVIDPVKGSFKIVGDTVGNAYQAASDLVVGGFDTVKKYAPLALAGVVAVLLLKK